jgi:hypothetical protein
VSAQDRKNENVIKLLYLTYFNLSHLFVSATEREMGHGFSDLVMIPNKANYHQGKYAYIIEFKYIKKKEEVESKILKAKEQLDKYGKDEWTLKTHGIAPYGDVILKKLIVVFMGWKIVYLGEYNS